MNGRKEDKIMGSYYEHTRREKVEVPYSFQCEQCGQNSGFLRAVIVGPEAETPSFFKTISSAREQKLGQKAHKYLVREIKRVHKDAVEKKLFSNFNDRCPHCGAPQSWAVSGLKDERLYKLFNNLGVGAFISGFVVVGHYLDIEELLTLPLAAGVFAVSVLVAGGLFVRRTIKINEIIKKTSSGMKNMPVIYWNTVQKLLDEQ